MTDQTADDRRGTTPADPGTNLTALSLTDDDRAALYPTPPYTTADLDTVGQYLPVPADPPADRHDIARRILDALTTAGWQPARLAEETPMPHHTADAAPYDAGDAPTLSRPLPTLDQYLTSARRLTPDTLRQTAEIQRITAEHAALTHAIDTADSVRIDSDGDIWRPTTDGRWKHPMRSGLTLDELHDLWGPTRPGLLIDLGTDEDEHEHDPTTAERLTTTAQTARDIADALEQTEHDLARTGRERDKLVDAISRLISLPPHEVATAYNVRYERTTAVLGSGPGRAQGQQLPVYHMARGHAPSRVEADCPCPTEPCGAVASTRTVPDCPHHPAAQAHTMRHMHRADHCPARKG